MSKTVRDPIPSCYRTNMNLHIRFWLTPRSMTLYDLEWPWSASPMSEFSWNFAWFRWVGRQQRLHEWRQSRIVRGIIVPTKWSFQQCLNELGVERVAQSSTVASVSALRSAVGRILLVAMIAPGSSWRLLSRSRSTVRNLKTHTQSLLPLICQSDDPTWYDRSLYGTSLGPCSWCDGVVCYNEIGHWPFELEIISQINVAWSVFIQCRTCNPSVIPLLVSSRFAEISVRV